MAGIYEVSTKTRRLRHLLVMALGQQELGRRIAEAREQAGLSQAQLAERLGLKHPQSISRYERGLTEMPQKRLWKIAEETKKPLSFFLEDAPAETGDPRPVEDAETLGLVRQVLHEIQDLRADVQRLADPPAQPGTP